MVFISWKVLPDGTRIETRRYGSWKEICDALDLSFTTLRRLEKDYGFPIRHMPGKRGRVFAYQDEIEDWLRKNGSFKTKNPGQAGEI